MKRIVPAVLVVGALALAACGSSSKSSSTATTTAGGGSPATTAASGGGSTTLTESGSSLLYPYLQVVAAAFHASDPSITVNTAAGGSGLGVSDAEAGNTSFGGSDAYLSSTVAAANPTLLNIPIAVSSQTVDYNLKGVTGLKLTGAVIAEIYQGKITKWNDPAISALNPGKTLPATAIVPVRRSDSSGDTFLFTSFLTKTSPSWASSVANGTTVNWPSVGSEATAQGNSGMVQACGKTAGCIAYIGISAQSDALAAGLGEATLQNASGQYVTDTSASVNAAVAAGLPSIPASFGGSLIDTSGATSYPIVNFEYIIVKSHESNATTAAAIRKFLDYAVSPTGGATAANLAKDNFEALPSSLLPKVEAAIATI